MDSTTPAGNAAAPESHIDDSSDPTSTGTVACVVPLLPPLDHEPSSLSPGLCLDTKVLLSHVGAYLENSNVQCNFDVSTPKGHEPDNKHYRWRCKRHGNPSNKGTGLRPGRNSLKCNCAMTITARHPLVLDDANSKSRAWDKSKLVLKKVQLEHTNGCTGGEDENLNALIRQRGGRNYDNVILNILREDVKAGHYGTDDVRSKLVDFGLPDVTLEEATNLRYRLMKDLPIKGWEWEGTNVSSIWSAGMVNEPHPVSFHFCINEHSF